ncbi:MAG: ATPase, T2SS/T4P/T4SS family, partial [Planctomycetota bacterium]
MTQSIGEYLVSKGVLEDAQLREALVLQSQSGKRLEDCLLSLGVVDEPTLARGWAKLEGLPFVDLDKGRVSADVLERVPEEIARDQGIVPLKVTGNTLIVAIDDPFKKIIADQLQFMLDLEVRCALATPSALKRAIQTYYGTAAADEIAGRMGAGGADDDPDDAPIVRLVTKMFQEALQMRTSDIHIEPGHGGVRIRFRIDGMLRDIATHPEHLAAPLLSRLKILAQMDIAEKRKPQDGRIELELEGRQIDVRASILPASHGESMVMRLLDRSANLLSLSDLGFEDENYAWFQKQIAKPYGICLVTGPTG